MTFRRRHVAGVGHELRNWRLVTAVSSIQKPSTETGPQGFSSDSAFAAHREGSRVSRPCLRPAAARLDQVRLPWKRPPTALSRRPARGGRESFRFPAKAGLPARPVVTAWFLADQLGPGDRFRPQFRDLAGMAGIELVGLATTNTGRSRAASRLTPSKGSERGTPAGPWRPLPGGGGAWPGRGRDGRSLRNFPFGLFSPRSPQMLPARRSVQERRRDGPIAVVKSASPVNTGPIRISARTPGVHEGPSGDGVAAHRMASEDHPFSAGFASITRSRSPPRPLVVVADGGIAVAAGRRR